MSILPCSLILFYFQVGDHLSQLPINALPGIGNVLQEKLKKQNVHTCGQLHMISKVLLFSIHSLSILFLLIFPDILKVQLLFLNVNL